MQSSQMPKSLAAANHGVGGVCGRCRIDVGTCLANPFPGRLHVPLSLTSAHPLALLAWLLSGITCQSFVPPRPVQT